MTTAKIKIPEQIIKIPEQITEVKESDIYYYYNEGGDKNEVIYSDKNQFPIVIERIDPLKETFTRQEVIDKMLSIRHIHDFIHINNVYKLFGIDFETEIKPNLK